MIGAAHNRTPKGYLGALLILVLLVVGCASENSSDAGDLGDLLTLANDYQTEALEDGIVTHAEYERAVFDARSCVEAAVGDEISVTGPVPRPDGSLGLDFAWGTEAGDPSAKVEQETLRCLADYVDLIETAYLRTNGPSQSAVRDEIDALVQCLREAGFEDVTHESSKLQVSELVMETTPEMTSAGGKCIVTHQLGFDNLADG